MSHASPPALWRGDASAGFQNTGMFNGIMNADMFGNPAVSAMQTGPVKSGLYSSAHPPAMPLDFSSQIHHSTPTHQGLYGSNAPGFQINYVIQTSAAEFRACPQFYILRPQAVTEATRSGIAIGTLTFPDQLPSAVPEGTTVRQLSHKYEKTFLQFQRYGQGFRMSFDAARTPAGQSIMKAYFSLLRTNFLLFSRLLITTALLVAKNSHRDYLKSIMDQGTLANNPMGVASMGSVGMLHRGEKSIYQIINTATRAGAAVKASPYTVALVTPRALDIMAYGNPQSTSYASRGPEGPQILKLGGDFFRQHGVGGVQFFEEKGATVGRSGDEGNDPINPLVRDVNLGRHYYHSFEQMLPKCDGVNFLDSAQFAFLNLDVEDGRIEVQSYSTLLRACSMFDPADGKLNKTIYDKLVSNGGGYLEELAKSINSRFDRRRGAHIDPFVVCLPDRSPKIVKYLGSQDVHYTSLDHQDIIVTKAVEAIKKRLPAQVVTDIFNVVNFVIKNATVGEAQGSDFRKACAVALFIRKALASSAGKSSEPSQMIHLPWIVETGADESKTSEYYVSPSKEWLDAIVSMENFPSSDGKAQPAKAYMRLRDAIYFYSRVSIAWSTYRDTSKWDHVKNTSDLASFLAMESSSAFRSFGTLFAAEIDGATTPDEIFSRIIDNTETNNLKAFLNVIGVKAVRDYIPGFSSVSKIHFLAGFSADSANNLDGWKQILSDRIRKIIESGADSLDILFGFLGNVFSTATAPNIFVSNNVISNQKLQTLILFPGLNHLDINYGRTFAASSSSASSSASSSLDPPSAKRAIWATQFDKAEIEQDWVKMDDFFFSGEEEIIAGFSPNTRIVISSMSQRQADFPYPSDPSISEYQQQFQRPLVLADAAFGFGNPGDQDYSESQIRTLASARPRDLKRNENRRTDEVLASIADADDIFNIFWDLRRKQSSHRNSVLTTDDLLKHLCNSFYCGTQVHRDVFLQMAKNNVPPPLSFLIADPFIRLRTSAIVFASGAQDTGLLAYTLPDLSQGVDADHKMLDYSFTVHLGAMVTQDKNILVYPDAVFEGYLGGGDGKFITRGVGDLHSDSSSYVMLASPSDVDLGYNPYSGARTGNRFVFAMGASTPHSSIPTYLALAGPVNNRSLGLSPWVPKSMTTEAGTQNYPLSYDSGYFNLIKFGFHIAVNSRKSAEQLNANASYNDESRVVAHASFITSQGDQWTLNPTTGLCTEPIHKGQGALGSIPVGGMKSVRGEITTLETIARLSSGQLTAVY